MSVTNTILEFTEPADTPPAKITKPDGNDAAAKLDRACPRPEGYLDHLFLAESYRSAYEDRVNSPEANMSAKPPHISEQILRKFRSCI